MRVVMLVANGVQGDSRVQKIAWSMAQAGWDVTLVGRAPAGATRREEYRLGAARVLLVPVGDELSGYQKVRLRGSAAARRRAAYREARAVVSRWDARDGGSRWRASLRAWLAGRPRWDAWVGRFASGPVGGAAVLAASGARGLTDRHGGWRSFNPWFRDLELAFAPVIEELEPDLIHAHDFHMVGIGARAAARLSTPERQVRWVYDAHEYLAGIDVPTRRDLRGRLRRRMLMGVEREYIGRADAVVTVSRGIAERLRADHALRRDPVVILNAPILASPRKGAGGEPTAPAGVGLREVLGLDRETPLLVYSGGMAPRRGVASVIRGLAGLPGVHLALVARDDDPDIPGLLELAAREGVRERVHTAPYVSPDRVVEYIASATAGLIPILHRPNHELSLITKYFEYLHAGLPIVCSDVREMARATQELGVGEVHRAGDPADFAAAVGRVLADPGRYRAAYQECGPGAEAVREYSWPRQVAQLGALYAVLLGQAPAGDEPPAAVGELTLRPVG